MHLMQLEDSDLDSFCTWLCHREHEIVGRPGMVYHCPLAQWLSECAGHIYGVDSRVYGRARAPITAGGSYRTGLRSLSPGLKC